MQVPFAPLTFSVVAGDESGYLTKTTPRNTQTTPVAEADYEILNHCFYTADSPGIHYSV